MKEETVYIWSDGSSINNPGPGGFGAVIVFPSGVVEERGGEDHMTTNNRMELSAALHALTAVAFHRGPVVVFTDSQYLIKGITQWVKGWKRSNWITSTKDPVQNKDLWEALDAAVSDLSVTWKHVKGHVGHALNERVDEIARSFAEERPVELFNGPLANYSIDIEEALAFQLKGEAPYTPVYLSLVEGKLYRDDTWAMCESRVRAKKGVRFKKIKTLSEEQAVLKSWGVEI